MKTKQTKSIKGNSISPHPNLQSRDKMKRTFVKDHETGSVRELRSFYSSLHQHSVVIQYHFLIRIILFNLAMLTKIVIYFY